MNKKKIVDYKWILIITVIAFIISFIFTLISEIAIPNISLIMGIFLTILFIVVGVFFDMIGVAITVSDIAPLNSMASKKVRGAKTAILIKKNAEKVSSFCNDVIGDICGIISGSSGSVVAIKLSNTLQIDKIIIVLITMGIISALTIGGKALEKGIAIKKSDKILFRFAYILSFFRREK